MFKHKVGECCVQLTHGSTFKVADVAVGPLGLRYSVSQLRSLCHVMFRYGHSLLNLVWSIAFSILGFENFVPELKL